MTPPDTGRHGAFVSSDEMLKSINSLTVAVAENNVQLRAVLDEMKEVKVDVDTQRKDIDAVKAKLYTMSGVIGIAVSVATNWITSQVNN